MEEYSAKKKTKKNKKKLKGSRKLNVITCVRSEYLSIQVAKMKGIKNKNKQLHYPLNQPLIIVVSSSLID